MDGENAHRQVMAHQAIDHNMTNHAPGPEAVKAIEGLRFLGKEFAHRILDLCPESRERSLALTNAEQALMWAVAAVARYQSAPTERLGQ